MAVGRPLRRSKSRSNKHGLRYRSGGLASGQCQRLWAACLLALGGSAADPWQAAAAAEPAAAAPIATPAADPSFNTGFLHGRVSPEDLTALSHHANDSILPGTYPFSIFLNGEEIDQRDVSFVRDAAGGEVEPCFSAAQLQGYGLILPADSAADSARPSAAPTPTPTPAEAASCYPLQQRIHDAEVHYDASIQRLDFSIPQLDLKHRPQGEVPNQLLDQGITAGFLNYSFNGSHNEYNRNNPSSNYLYLNLVTGFNYGPWRLRNNGNFNKETGEHLHYQNNGTWLERDIIRWHSRLVLGQHYTDNTVFDSFQFRGAQIGTDSSIYPESMRGYAPVVRGVAHSNARVEIRQNGYVLYSAQVAPGPFAIHDIYPNNLSGSLDVTVVEADGSRQHFIVPYSSVPNMIRQGIWNYQATAGRYYADNSGGNNYRPYFFQGTVGRGLAHDFTPYAGVLAAEHYVAAAIGIGKGFGRFGAVSFDVTAARTELAQGSQAHGESFKFLYSKSLIRTGTEFQLIGERYSTSGYYGLQDAVQERNDWRHGYYRRLYYNTWDTWDRDYQGVPDDARSRRRYQYSRNYQNRRSNLQVNLNQRIGRHSSLYFNVSNQSYWGGGSKDRSIQLGFNTAVHRITLGLYAQDTRNQYHYHDRTYNLNVSIPIDLGSSKSLNTNFSVGHSKVSGTSVNAGVSGTLLDDNRLGYALQTGHTMQAGETSSAQLSYQSWMGDADVGYSYSDTYRSTTLDVRGGIVFHSGGVTLSQPLQDTFALIEAKHAHGVRVENQPGVTVDPLGYAVMPSLNPYRYNDVRLHTQDFKNGLDIPNAAQTVAPTKGAIVRIHYQTRIGRSFLIHLSLPDGRAPQLGAGVYGHNGQNLGIVGTQGNAYVSGVNSGDLLTVRWGQSASESCRLTLNDLPTASAAGFQRISRPCAPDSTQTPLR